MRAEKVGRLDTFTQPSENYTIRIYDGDASDSDNFRSNTRWNVASEISPIVLEEDMENILTGQRR